MAEAKPVAILGGGPVGLAAAAQALERGMEPVVLEAGPEAGHAVRQWAHVRMFSPWEYNVDKAAARTPLKDRIRTTSLVTGVGRAGSDKVRSKGREMAPFAIRYENGRGPEQLSADAVVDAAGTWFAPNPAGAAGRPAKGERELQDRLLYGMPDALGRDRARYAGRSVAVLGAGHSAVGTLIDLAQPEPGFYLAGMKSYGRAPTFLVVTGYEQVRSIAGDHDAARKVELVLPESGVCSGPGPFASPLAAPSACCG